MVTDRCCDHHGHSFFSNPDEADHKYRMKEMAKDLSVKVKDNAIEVDNYKIFSIVTAK